MSVLTEANRVAGERMAAALHLDDSEATELQRSKSVTRLRAVFTGTDVSAEEVEEFVRDFVNHTFAQYADRELDGEGVWRMAAGLAYRMLLVGVLAGQGGAT